MKEMKIKLLTGIYILLLVAIIFCADHVSYQSSFSFIREIPGGDALGHFTLMGLFAFLSNISLNCRAVRVVGRPVLLGSTTVIALITVEEVSQSLIPHRSFDLFDLAADYLGVMASGRAARILCSREDSREVHSNGAT
jgi:polysaccharide biosynthesis protein VpsQ